MGFFGNTSAARSADINDLLKEDNLPMYEGMSIMEACYAGIAATEMNWNAIMEAAAETEMSYFAEHGEEYVYTEASGFFAKVSEFFKKIWQKIQALFKKFLVMIGSLVGKDKDFIKKYRETIQRNMKNIPKDAEIKGYVFTHTDVLKAIDKAGDQIKETFNDDGTIPEATKTKYHLDSDDYDASETMEEVRGAMITNLQGISGSTFTESEMREAVFAACRNGEDSPIDIQMTTARVSEAMSHLEGGDKAKKDAAKAYTNVEKKFKDVIKKAEQLETKGYKDKNNNPGPDALKILNRGINLAKSASSSLQTICAVYLQAVKDEYAQDRKICVKVVTYKEIKEGATVEHFAEGAFGKVSLI